MQPKITTPYFIEIGTADNDKNTHREDSVLIKRWFKEFYEQSEEYCGLQIHIKIPSKYRGGKQGFERQFKKTYDSLNYPKFSGIIKMGLLIDKTGSIESVQLIKGKNRDIDKAVINTLQKMPLWKPAVENGRHVPFYVEVQFENL